MSGEIHVIIESIRQHVRRWSGSYREEAAAIQYLLIVDVELKKHEPFSFFANKWMIGPNGSKVNLNAVTSVAPWVVDQIMMGTSTQDIIEKARNQKIQKPLRVLEVSDLHGIATTSALEIENGLFVWPNEILPESSNKRAVFYSRHGPFFVNEGNAAIVQFTTIETPIVDNPDDATEVVAAQLKQAEENRAQRGLLSLALTLATNEPTFIANTYHVWPEDWMFGDISGRSSALEKPLIFQQAEFPMSEIELLLPAIRKFQSSRSMTTALERVARARRGFDAVNQAIDLGMALEIALMHNEQDSNQEISYKLGMRAGWLLGNSPEERIEAKKTAKNLYGARSSAVHRGQVDQKKFDFASSNEFVTNMLKRIVALGDFPNWDRLSFGAM